MLNNIVINVEQLLLTKPDFLSGSTKDKIDESNYISKFKLSSSVKLVDAQSTSTITFTKLITQSFALL